VHDATRELTQPVRAQHEPGGVKNIAPDAPRRCNAGNGSIIALSYEARAAGVKRGMRGEEARRACAAIQLVQVPTSHQKADISIYRDEGRAVIDVLLRRVAVVERASVDEAYLELTAEAAALLEAQGLAACVAAAEGTHVGGVEEMPEAKLPVSALRRGHATNAVAGADDGAPAATPPERLSAAWLARDAVWWTREEMCLVAGAALVRQLREDVRATLGHTCSAGVAGNKLLAKLATGLRKPDAQTLLPPVSTAALLRDLPLARLRGLGGAFGAQVASELGCATVGELAAVPLPRLQSRFGEERGVYVHRLARGESDEAVKARDVPNSIGASKTFRGSLALRGAAAARAWLRELAEELEERLAEDRALNGRTARLLTVSSQPLNGGSFSLSCPLRAGGAAAMADDAAALLRRWEAGQPEAACLQHLGLKASNFMLDVHGMRSITDFLAPAPQGGAGGGAGVEEADAAARAAAPQAPPPPQQQPMGMRRFFGGSAVSDADAPARTAAASPQMEPAPPTGLRRFFAAASQQPPPCSGDGGGEGEQAPPSSRCGRCGREVAGGHEPQQEHADFHFAQDLARQEQRAAAPSGQPPGKRGKTSGPLDALLQRSGARHK
jgi:DNA polymerase eta